MVWIQPVKSANMLKITPWVGGVKRGKREFKIQKAKGKI
jgi:hypothetical protein